MNKQWYSQEEYDEAIREAREEGRQEVYENMRDAIAYGDVDL